MAKNMLTKLGKDIVAGATSISLLAAPVAGQVVGRFLKYVQPVEGVEGQNKSYIEPNTFYKLPGGIQGFTWMDFYQGNGYYGESNFERKIVPGFNAKAQLNHPNDLMGRLGMGASVKVPFLPKDAFGKITAFPVFFDKNGNITDRSEIGYFVQANLPYGIEASSFGEVAQENGEKPKWIYGELKVERRLGKNGIKIGYNHALRNAGKGKLIPRVQHRIHMSANFN